MHIDIETFTEFAMHLSFASNALLKMARQLVVISKEQAGSQEHWTGAINSLWDLNKELIVMEKLHRAIGKANQEENAPQDY